MKTVLPSNVPIRKILSSEVAPDARRSRCSGYSDTPRARRQLTQAGAALKRLLEHGVRLDGASDHGVSEALYLTDPDGNGLELYWDRPTEEWPRDASGTLSMVTASLDLNALLA